MRENLAARMHLIPRYRQKAVFPPFFAGHPTWEDDPQFTLERHVYGVEVPSPGRDPQLTELACGISEDALPRDRPLWDLGVVHGLAGGRTAFVQHVHHCMIDGVSAVELALATLDLVPNPPPIPPPPAAWQPARPPDAVRSWGDALFDQWASNMSAITEFQRNLLDPRFPATLKEIVATSGTPARQIKLEITESALMTEPARVLETMNELRAIGFGFSIDDFGTGYSSLAYLQRLPVEEIKIDRSFVGELSNNAGSGAIVRATIELAGGLGLDVVAEGVEDESTWQSLGRLGCSTAQGYFLSRPMPPSEVEAWLAEWSKRSDRLQAA